MKIGLDIDVVEINSYSHSFIFLILGGKRKFSFVFSIKKLHFLNLNNILRYNSSTFVLLISSFKLI